ncbi:rsuA [Scenedesmus sp. PABB004]|nr:rsuA [Scenedesmus sp. PABB004]
MLGWLPPAGAAAAQWAPLAAAGAVRLLSTAAAGAQRQAAEQAAQHPQPHQARQRGPSAASPRRQRRPRGAREEAWPRPAAPTASAVVPGASARELTAQLKRAEAPRDLVALVVAAAPRLNHIHVVAALRRAAALWPSTAAPPAGDGGAGPAEQLVARQQLHALVEGLSGPLGRALPRCSVEDVAGVLSAYAHCGLAPPPELAAAAAARAAWGELQAASPGTLVSFAWAAAKLGLGDRQLFAAVAAAAGPAAPEMHARHVGSLLWALSHGRRDDALPALPALCARLRAALDDALAARQAGAGAAPRGARGPGGGLSAAALGSAAHSLSRLRFAEPGVMARVAALAAAPPTLHDVRPHDAAALLSGFAAAAGTGPLGNDAPAGGGGGGVGGAGAPAAGAADAAHAADDDGEPARQRPAAKEQLLPAAVALATAALRRLDEATLLTLARVLWGLAATAARQPPGATQEAGAAGSVFQQLCAALTARGAPDLYSLTVVAWALAHGQSGLASAPEQQPVGAWAARGALPSQELLEAVLQAVSAQAAALVEQPEQLGDLAAALERLRARSRPAAADDNAPDAGDNGGAASGADAPDAQLAAAAAALAAAAEQLPPSRPLPVHAAARLASSLAGLGVGSEALFAALAARFTPAELASCAEASLVAAARAAARIAAVAPGALGDDVWAALRAAASRRQPALSEGARVGSEGAGAAAGSGSGSGSDGAAAGSGSGSGSGSDDAARLLARLAAAAAAADKPVRVERILSNLGHGTRAECAALIRRRRLVLAASGAPARVGDKARPRELLLDGEPLDPAPLALVLNKPRGYVVTSPDDEAVSDPKIYDLLPFRFGRRKPFLSAIGRLDKDTSGLLLLTDDGKLLHSIQSPAKGIWKLYEASLAEPLEGKAAAAAARKFGSGRLLLHGERTPLLPAGLRMLDATTAEVAVCEGRYHQVRRMFAALGNEVVALRRHAIGGLRLDDEADLPEGSWRVATPEDLAAVLGGPDLGEAIAAAQGGDEGDAAPQQPPPPQPRPRAGAAGSSSGGGGSSGSGGLGEGPEEELLLEDAEEQLAATRRYKSSSRWAKRRAAVARSMAGVRWADQPGGRRGGGGDGE